MRKLRKGESYDRTDRPIFTSNNTYKSPKSACLNRLEDERLKHSENARTFCLLPRICSKSALIAVLSGVGFREQKNRIAKVLDVVVFNVYKNMAFGHKNGLVQLSSEQCCQELPTRNILDSLKPTAYSLLLIFVSMFSLSDAWAQSVEIRTAERHGVNHVKDMIFPRIKYDYEGDANIGLHVGDHITDDLWDMPLRVIYSNAGMDTINLRSLSDKRLIIIDFWSTWCGPCISSVEKWHAIFPKYKQHLAVLTVHMDYDYKALPFIAKRNWIFPVVIGQAQADLNRYFFDKYQVGGQVFIVDGIVAAICYSGESDINKQHLDDLFKGNFDPINFVSTSINTY